MTALAATVELLIREGQRDNPNAGRFGDITFAIALVPRDWLAPGEEMCGHGYPTPCFVCGNYDAHSWLRARRFASRCGPVAVLPAADVGRMIALERIASTIWCGLMAVPPDEPRYFVIADTLEAMPSDVDPVLVEFKQVSE